MKPTSSPLQFLAKSTRALRSCLYQISIGFLLTTLIFVVSCSDEDLRKKKLREEAHETEVARSKLENESKNKKINIVWSRIQDRNAFLSKAHGTYFGNETYKHDNDEKWYEFDFTIRLEHISPKIQRNQIVSPEDALEIEKQTRLRVLVELEVMDSSNPASSSTDVCEFELASQELDYNNPSLLLSNNSCSKVFLTLPISQVEYRAYTDGRTSAAQLFQNLRSIPTKVEKVQPLHHMLIYIRFKNGISPRILIVSKSL